MNRRLTPAFERTSEAASQRSQRWVIKSSEGLMTESTSSKMASTSLLKRLFFFCLAAVHFWVTVQLRSQGGTIEAAEAFMLGLLLIVLVAWQEEWTSRARWLFWSLFIICLVLATANLISLWHIR